MFLDAHRHKLGLFVARGQERIELAVGVARGQERIDLAVGREALKHPYHRRSHRASPLADEGG
jgi:hypothetical protein